MIAEIHRIAELQLQYSSENTAAMKERGTLIRSSLPALLRAYMVEFRESLGRFGEDLEIEGRDGIGRKTEAPWVRLFSENLSPSATTGFYVVIHFALDGQKFFVTVGCASTRWVAERGELIPYSDDELNKKLSWARSVLIRAGVDSTGFPDKIVIGASNPLPQSFEKATMLAKALDARTTEMPELVSKINEALKILSVIYEAYSQGSDLKTSEAIDLEVEFVSNPGRQIPGRGQGYGLTAPEKFAVETRAMDVTRSYLENMGYTLDDHSRKHPYDFLAKRNGEEIKVEVKGTTSASVDAVLMTATEVELHLAESGNTALAIVSNIVLTSRGERASAEGGTLEFLSPWEIRKWQLKPKAFEVLRPRA